MILQDPPSAHKKTSKQEVPIHAQLEEKFSIKDLHQRKQRVVSAIFEFYYPKLDKQIPYWLRNVAAEDDAEGLASQILLEVIERCEQYGSFKELDDAIHTKFEKSKNKANSQVVKVKENKDKQVKLDAPIYEGENDTRHHIVSAKDEKNGSDLLIDKEEGLEVKKDAEEEKEEKRKAFINTRAREIFSAGQWKIYDLLFNKSMSPEAIAVAVNKPLPSIIRSLNAIKRNIQAHIFPDRYYPAPRSPIPETDSDFWIVLRAYRMGISLEKIQKRFDLDSNGFAQILRKAKNRDEYTQARERAEKRQIYQAYATNTSEDDIIQRFNLQDNAALQKIIQESGQEDELEARRGIDRSQPTPLDMFAKEYAQQQVSNEPISEKTLEKFRNKIIAIADWDLSPIFERIVFSLLPRGYVT